MIEGIDLSRYTANIDGLNPSDRALCVGDRIEMVCSITAPPSEMFSSSIAFVLINGSTPFTLVSILTV